MIDDWHCHLENMQRAIDQEKLCQPEDDRKSHPKVGVVISYNGQIMEARRGEEEPGEHGEYTALAKKLRVKEGRKLPGATLYTTLEPCTSRMHPKRPCWEWIVDAEVARVFIGILDPNPVVCGVGEWILKHHGIKVDHFPSDLQVVIENDNEKFINEQKPRLLKKIIDVRKLITLVVPCKRCNEPHEITVHLSEWGTNRVVTCSQCNGETVVHLVGEEGEFFTDPEGKEPYGISPAEGLSLRNAIQRQFKRSQFRVKPEDLRGLLRLMTDTERQLKAENCVLTPKRLMEAMRSSEELHRYHVKRKAIHEFFNYLVLWGYFQFETESGPKFHRPYSNNFDKTHVINCYLKAYLSILRNNDIIKDSDSASEASRYLLGEVTEHASQLGKELWATHFAQKT